jgi:predicted secreted protein
MAKPTTCASSKMIIKLGNGATPEVFAAPCGMTTKGINFTKATNEVNVPDCDDPDAAAWIERSVVSMSAEISENGILAMEALDDWQSFLDSTISRNVQVWLDVPAVDHGGHWNGKFLLTGFNVTAEQGNKVQAAVTMQSDGPVTWTAAP